METQLPKQVYYQDSTFVLETQFCENNLFIHCEVKTWKPSSLRRGYSVFKSLLSESEQAGISKVVTITPNPKFAKLFGGTTIFEIDYNNIKHEVIVWDLKHKPLS